MTMTAYLMRTSKGSIMKVKSLKCPRKKGKERKGGELQQDTLDNVEPMDIENTDDQKSKRSGLDLELGGPCRASTPAKAVPSSSDGTPGEKSMPRNSRQRHAPCW